MSGIIYNKLFVIDDNIILNHSNKYYSLKFNKHSTKYREIISCYYEVVNIDMPSEIIYYRRIV